MASYYYLSASLPMLLPDAPPPLRYDEFLALCEPAVSAETYRDLQALVPTKGGNPLLNDWAAFYGGLQQELCYRREEALGKSPIPPEDRTHAELAQAAMTAPDPLAAELLLLRAEFEAIDQLMGLHAFDTAFLFGYAIKLRLLERQHCFRQKEGRQEFTTLLKAIQQEIYDL